MKRWGVLVLVSVVLSGWGHATPLTQTPVAQAALQAKPSQPASGVAAPAPSSVGPEDNGKPVPAAASGGLAGSDVAWWGLGALLLAAAAWGLRGWQARARSGKPSGSAAHPDWPPHSLQNTAGRSPRNYSPQNVGNDASARPWERSTHGFENSRLGEAALPAGGGLTGSGLLKSAAWGIPEGFDVAAFLEASKANFVALQAAWDRSDIPSLRAMMTDDMLAQIKSQLAEREQHSGSAENVTEVVMLEARLLGIEELADAHMASVEFSGMIREEVAAGPNPFREVWNITRPKSGSGGWLVAGVQALQ